MTVTIKTADDNRLRRRADVLWEADQMHGDTGAAAQIKAMAYEGYPAEWNDLEAVVSEIERRGLYYQYPSKLHEEVAVTMQKPWWE